MYENIRKDSFLIDKTKINRIEIYFLSATWKKGKKPKTNPPLSFNAEHIPSPNNIFKILRQITFCRPFGLGALRVEFYFCFPTIYIYVPNQV
jgi:hypothetical protein